MDRTLGENGPLTLREGVDDEASTVLLNETGVHLTVNEEQELGSPGVGMRGVHSARSGLDALERRSGRIMHSHDSRQLTDSQGHPVREECREVGDVGDGEVPATIPGGPNSSIVIE